MKKWFKKSNQEIEKYTKLELTLPMVLILSSDHHVSLVSTNQD